MCDVFLSFWRLYPRTRALIATLAVVVVVAVAAVVVIIAVAIIIAATAAAAATPTVLCIFGLVLSRRVVIHTPWIIVS